MSYRPHLLPKVRSEPLMDAIGGKFGGVKSRECYPCTLRIAGLVGQRCADRDTVVGAHTGNLGKGQSTKVSDLSVAGACMVCHGLYDRVLTGWINLNDDPVLKVEMIIRVLAGLHETQAMLFDDGIISVKGSVII